MSAEKKASNEKAQKAAADITGGEQAEEQVLDLAKFPAENPYPVLRILQNGKIIYSNGPGKLLLESWKKTIGQTAPPAWCKTVSKALKLRRYLIKEAHCRKRIFSFAVAPAADGEYVNLYGLDVTTRKLAEKSLQKSQEQLSSQLAEIESIYNTAVVGLCVFDRDLRYVRINRYMAEMNGLSIEEHIGRTPRQITPDTAGLAEKIARKVFSTGEPLLDVELSGKTAVEPGVLHYWKQQWLPVKDDAGSVTGINVVSEDVTRAKQMEKALLESRDQLEILVQQRTAQLTQTVRTLQEEVIERKRVETRSRTTNRLLELFADKTSRQEYLDSAVEVIRNWSGCRCVGIRLINADGYIPYASYVGFSKEFLSLESNLCLNKDVCACIRVIAQTPEPQDTKVMTERGSFRCDNTFGFVGSLTEDEKKRFRGNCLKAGFTSVAVVPVLYRHEILGAIHIADEGKNKVPLETVEFLEDMAALVGEAVHRFNVEESLRLNQSRLLEAQRLASLGNWEWDIISNGLWWSDEIYRIFGREPQQFGATYDAFLSYVHPDDRKFVEESVNKALYDGQVYNIDHRLIRPDGSERIVNERAKVTYDSEHRPVKMIGTVHDITEQKKAEDEIRNNQAQLRALTAELQLTEERERRQIAQDLHDSIGQVLAFSDIELKRLQKSLPEKSAKSVELITNQIDIAIEQARNLSFDLSPSTLYDFGLEAAIEDLVEKMGRERKLRCRFENCDSPKPLTNNVKVLLYRCIRELLINVAKHANADMVNVSLARSSSDIYIKVEDDGDGFDPSVLEDGLKKGFGIFSIRERLDHIGGYMKIESAKGRGTKTILIAPLDINRESE